MKKQIHSKRGFFIFEITLWTLLFGGILVLSVQITSRHYHLAYKQLDSFNNQWTELSVPRSLNE